eukprot:scaffold66933_cov66-Phaeocystis_antarctica.AAC.2
MAMANQSLRRRSIAASLTIALEDQVARPIPAKRALPPEIVCPLPGVARSGQKWRRLFAGNPPPPICGRGGRECGGSGRVRSEIGPGPVLALCVLTGWGEFSFITPYGWLTA